MSMNKGIRPGIPAGARPSRSGGPSPFVAEQIEKRKVATQAQEPEPEVTRTKRVDPMPDVTAQAAALANPKALEETAPDAQDVAASSEFERVDLPSSYAFYEWSELSLRPLDVFDQAKLARAVRHRNWTLLIDVMQATCNRDVRSLAVSDFYALCIWHKHSSYLAGRSRISYVSMYGNRINGANPSAIKIKDKKLEKTRADYLDAVSRGFAISTMRDLETINANELDEDLLFLFEKAQYVSLEGLDARIAELSKAGDRCASITARIEELARRQKAEGLSQVFEATEAFENDFAAFGIEEVAVVKDTKFEAKAALDYLNTVIDASDSDAPRYEEFVAERDRISEAIKAGVAVEAKVEEVPLTFDQWTMFPHT